MSSVCDACRTQIVASNEGTPATIGLFPCFHKHCERCKSSLLGNPNERVACKVCGTQCLPAQIYDYTEIPLERIYCMHCNIKNHSPVEWCCETCQKQYLCNSCSNPHVISAHTLVPAKPSIPPRSQCSSHLNVQATYICSCQTRLCVHCLNVHANGQLIPPHEQRYPFAQLADQARLRLQNSHASSQQEQAKLHKLVPVMERNKTFVHEVANKARHAIAEQIVELCNAMIRRGNDIVMHIDAMEAEKLQKYALVEQELKILMERFKKIGTFSETALVTMQQDHPGMCSASDFAQGVLQMQNKRLEGLQQDIHSTQRLPKITYQSDLTQLVQSIRLLGIVDVDGTKICPQLTTPQNAKMFTSVPLPSPTMNSPVVNPPGGATLIRNPNPLIRPNLHTVNITASSAMNPAAAGQWNMQIPPVGNVTAATQAQLAAGRMAISIPQLRPGAILPHLLQQQHNIIQPVQQIPCSSTANGTPTSSNFVLQQSTEHQQQDVNLLQQQQLATLQQQQREYLQRQQMRQVQQQRMQILQQQQVKAQQQTAQPNMHQQQQLLQQLQAQQRLHQQQQQRMQQMQQIQQGHAVAQRQSEQAQHQQQLAGDGLQNPPILLRIPNPYKHPIQAQQQLPNLQQSLTPVVSNCSSSSLSTPRFMSPLQPSIFMGQQMMNMSSPPALFSTSLPQMQMTSNAQAHISHGESHPALQQQTQSTQRKQQQQPAVVDLVDEDEGADQANIANKTTVHLVSIGRDDSVQQHPMPRLKAQSVAADSTVNAGGGLSGEDASASPSPSTSSMAVKRPPPPQQEQPCPKRPRKEGSNGEIVSEGERSNNSPSTTTLENESINDIEDRSHGIAGEIKGDRAHTSATILKAALGSPGKNSGGGETASQPAAPRTTPKCAVISSMQHLVNPGTSSAGVNNGPTSNSSGEEAPIENREERISDGGKSIRQDDYWDDYCYVCSQGCDESTGSLGCCEACPRVFHANCHVPIVNVPMEALPDDWRCTMCLPCAPRDQTTSTFDEQDKLLCSKVYLACFEDNMKVEPFLNEVPHSEADYYAVIKNPIWLTLIGKKISNAEYKNISEFIEDMNLLFRNCSTFNSQNDHLAEYGKEIYSHYIKAVRKHLPAYEKQIWIYVSLYSRHAAAAGSDEESRKRTRRGLTKSQTPSDTGR